MGYLGYKPADKPLTAADITDSIITSAKIVDGTIVNGDINASAAIASTKLSGITSPAGFRNIVINGDMQIAQRSTSKSSITTDAYHTVDRFLTTINSLGTWTQSQSTDVPSGYGFSKSFKMDCTTADASPSAGDYLFIRQMFEGQNLQYLKKGTANAVSLTASFWVKSTKTGTHIVQLLDQDNNRSVSKSYTINTTNTWEFKTLTFPPDTTGALDNDNASSLQLRFWLGAGTTYTSGTLNTTWESGVSANTAVGQVNLADSTSNDWLITGVQLEAGTSATDFEFLPIDVSLGRSLRYYEKFLAETVAGCINNTCMAVTTDTLGIMFKTTQRMRAIPTGNYSGTIQVGDGTANYNITSMTVAGSQCNAYMTFFNAYVASGLTAFRWYRLEATAGTDFVELSAEL
jgi:hypothetical protein